MRTLLKDKKGVLGLDTVKAVMLTFLVMGVIGIAILLALVSLQNANIFTTGSTAANQSTATINNISGGIANFFGNTGTIFAILVVVVIIAAIALIIAYVTRFGGGGGTL